jgi:integrase
LPKPKRAVYGLVKRAAAKAGINEAVSPHRLRHAHDAIDRGATLVSEWLRRRSACRRITFLWYTSFPPS